MRLLHYDNPWLAEAKKFLREIYEKGQHAHDSCNCTGMRNMSLIGFTHIPLFFNADEDQFYFYL